MLKKFKFNLQLFGEGGDGGDGSSSSDGEAADSSGEIEIPAFIPEKAKKNYREAMAKMSAVSKPKAVKSSEPSNTEDNHIPYEDMIKSDAYREEHQAYMEKTIGDRLKKYKGIEDTNAKMRNALEIVASKYGLDANDESFLDSLQAKIEEDDSYYEGYAMDHDISTEEAKRIVNLERKVAVSEAREREAQKQEAMRQQLALLQQNAQMTKQRFPNFDLETEMQNEKFRRLCAVNQGDTTAAFMACHWQDIMQSTAQMATRNAQTQASMTVAANKARPIENGMSSSASSVVTEDFSKMSLEEIRAYAAEQRRKTRR